LALKIFIDKITMIDKIDKLIEKNLFEALEQDSPEIKRSSPPQ
jgi:hypothetical protein